MPVIGVTTLAALGVRDLATSCAVLVKLPSSTGPGVIGMNVDLKVLEMLVKSWKRNACETLADGKS